MWVVSFVNETKLCPERKSIEQIPVKLKQVLTLRICTCITVMEFCVDNSSGSIPMRGSIVGAQEQ